MRPLCECGCERPVPPKRPDRYGYQPRYLPGHRHHPQRPKETLTAAQQLYLEAFDELLHARSPVEGRRARMRMATLLNYMLAERGMKLPADTRWSDSLHERDKKSS